MWSGPRNISTAMMRSFGARSDTSVVDEPFYAAYLAHTGLDHPMRAEVLASQPHDRREVVAALLGPVPDGNPGRVLARLCAALGIEYADAMLSWPAGRRATDGVWAPAWYGAVERSTGFEAPPRDPATLTPALQRVADAALPHYELMAAHRLR